MSLSVLLQRLWGAAAPLPSRRPGRTSLALGAGALLACAHAGTPSAVTPDPPLADRSHHGPAVILPSWRWPTGGPLPSAVLPSGVLDPRGPERAVPGATSAPLHYLSALRWRGTGEMVRGVLNGYRLGQWPAQPAVDPLGRYAPPARLAEVTPATQDTPVSAHFRLGDFLTKDQPHTWPKYVALEPRLIEKLELTIAELQRTGTAVRHLSVMSGFRTPAYNALGLAEGRAVRSRHQYGDASDVFVDNNEDGVLDDLTGDGRVDVRDAGVIEAAVNRVEAARPDLIGGMGVYPATGAHGPFVHIDARGQLARWGFARGVGGPHLAQAAPRAHGRPRVVLAFHGGRTRPS